MSLTHSDSLAAPYALITVDTAGRIAAANLQAERLFGCSREELVGSSVERWLPARLRGMHGGDRVDFCSLAGGGSEGALIEAVAVPGDGREIPVEVSAGLLETAAGTLVTIAVRDITERRLAGEAASLYQAVIAASEDALVTVDLDDVITSWNAGAEKLLGYRADEAIGQSVAIIRPLVEIEPGPSFVERVLAGERLANLEVARRRKDGAEIEVSVTLAPIHDRSGTIVGVTAVARDITGSKRMLDALREAEERFRGAFDGAPTGMVITALDGRYLRVNDAFCEIVGHSREQLEASSVESITHPEDFAADVGALNDLRAGKLSSYASERRYIHALGHAVQTATQVTVIRHADGAPAYLLTQVQDITERKRHEQQLVYQAEHDVLTGLLNRRAFGRALDAHGALVERYGPVGTILLLDLDHFKNVNDTLGHRAGDELIVHIARMLSERLRATDVLARIGGDEFGVLLPKADADSAQAVAEGLLEAFRGDPVTIGGVACKITASIGTASFADQPGAPAAQVLVNADLAMYDAKGAGRDRVARFLEGDPGERRMQGHVAWVQRIRAALDGDLFTLVAQPIVDLASGAVSQYELLLRMSDGRGGLIAPEAFLCVAERLDLIRQIDQWVVTHAIRQLGELDRTHPGVVVEINLSGRSLGDRALLEHIDRELQAAQVAPERIIFEVTETAAVTSFPSAREFAQRLSEIGCRFALDDFGAGFGTFYYLKHLSFDFVKIAGAFVRDCLRDSTDQLVIAAVVDIARGMGKPTIAEFVGDEQTLQLLGRLGVDYVQGNYLGKPAPLADQLLDRGWEPLARGGRPA